MVGCCGLQFKHSVALFGIFTSPISTLLRFFALHFCKDPKALDSSAPIARPRGRP